MTWKSHLPYHVALVLLATGVVVGARLAWPSHYTRNYDAVAEMATRERAAELLANWNGLTYLSSQETNLAELVVGHIESSSLGLSELQGSALKRRLNQVINYLQNPTLNEYYRLKAEGLNHSFELNRVAAAFFGPVQDTQNAALTSEAEVYATISRLWDLYHGTNVIPHLEGVSLTDIAFASTSTNSVGLLLKGKTGKLTILTREGLDPGFRYPKAPRMDSDSRGQFVNASFYIKISPSGRCGPLFLSFAWSEVDGMWALEEAAVDNYLDFTNLF